MELVVDFDKLSQSQEKEFMTILLQPEQENTQHEISHRVFRKELLTAILAAQHFVGFMGIERVHVSIRGILLLSRFYCDKNRIENRKTTFFVEIRASYGEVTV